jgi:hypothetical protein
MGISEIQLAAREVDREQKSNTLHSQRPKLQWHRFVFNSNWRRLKPERVAYQHPDGVQNALLVVWITGVNFGICLSCKSP